MKRKVFLFEDEVIIATDIKQILENEGFEVYVVYSFAEALKVINAGERFDIALLDIKQEIPLIEDAGIQIAKVFNLRNEGVPVIFLTAYPESFTQSLEVHPFSFCEKGFTNIEAEIPRAIRVALNKYYSETASLTAFPGKLCLKVRKNAGSLIYGRKEVKDAQSHIDRGNWNEIFRGERSEIIELINKYDLESKKGFENIIVDVNDIVQFEFITGEEDRYRELVENNQPVGVYHYKAEVNFIKIYVKGSNDNELVEYRIDNSSATEFNDLIKQSGTGLSIVKYNEGGYLNLAYLKKFDQYWVYITGNKKLGISSSGYQALREAFKSR